MSFISKRPDASSIGYDPSGSGLSSTTVQAALDEVAAGASGPNGPVIQQFLRCIRVAANGALRINSDAAMRISKGTDELNIVLGFVRVLQGGSLSMDGTLRITKG